MRGTGELEFQCLKFHFCIDLFVCMVDGGVADRGHVGGQRTSFRSEFSALTALVVGI